MKTITIGFVLAIMLSGIVTATPREIWINKQIEVLESSEWHIEPISTNKTMIVHQGEPSDVPPRNCPGLWDQVMVALRPTRDLWSSGPWSRSAARQKIPPADIHERQL